MTTLSLTEWSVKEETTYGTAVVPDRSMPIISEAIEPDFGITSAGDEMRNGALVETVDQGDPFKAGVAGPWEAYVPTKGFGLYLKHALGAVATAGPTDSNYTHTATLSATGKAALSMTAQTSRPFTTGSNQKFTLEGLVMTSCELSMDVEDFLKCSIDWDGEDHATGGSASVAYPTYAVAGASKFPWRLATVSVDGTQVEVKRFRVKVSWNMDTARRRLRGSELKKQPLPIGKPTIEWEIEPDWASLTYYNLLAATAITGRVKSIVATFPGSVALAGTTVPQLTVTLPAARFDKGFPPVSGEEPLAQPLSGVALYDLTNPPISIAYRTNDSTP